MNDNIVVIKMSEATKGPVAVFIGTKTEADAYMFRILANSEGPISKIENDYGLAFEVIETINAFEEQTEKRKKLVQKNVPVKYYIQRAYND